MKKTKLGNADSRNAAIFLLKSASNSIMNGDSYCAYASAIDAINVLKNNISDKDIKHLNKRDICVERFFMASLKGAKLWRKTHLKDFSRKLKPLLTMIEQRMKEKDLKGALSCNN